jgi:hypothetical protein
LKIHLAGVVRRADVIVMAAAASVLRDGTVLDV